MFESPALCIFLESFVEGFGTHHSLTENIQSRGSFAILFFTNADNVLTAGHQRAHCGLIAFHIRNNALCATASGFHVWIPFYLCQVLHEAVDTFVHPCGLALIVVDDHREEVMTNFMDHHADHTSLNAIADSSIFRGAAEVEADHRVLHTDTRGVHRCCLGI